VAATRARDLLVVPCSGDQPVAGWVDVLHPALYPAAGAHRDARPAPGCPAFGPDSVASRSIDAPPDAESSVAPGWHAIGDGHAVWWDPAVLALDPPPVGGVRQQDLLVSDEELGRDRTGIEEYERWRAGRAAALALGARASFEVTTATRLAAAEGAVTAVAVESAETGAARSERPRGRRFGTLVHAVLADVAFDAGAGEIERLVALHARLVGATGDEAAAAVAAVAAALSHDIMRRAARAAVRGRCHRELPLCWRDASGAFVDGVADLAFAEPAAGGQDGGDGGQDGGDGEGAGAGESWVVVDYKTDARPEAHDAYRAQVQIYARALAAATGRPVRGVLLAV
jgi:ATP-dependent helicase/nuclease subunit A